MSADNTVSFKMAFTNSPNTKSLSFGGVSSAALASVKSKVQDINYKLAHKSGEPLGNLMGLIFVDPETYNPLSPGNGGNLDKIFDVTITQTQVTKIPLF